MRIEHMARLASVLLLALASAAGCIEHRAGGDASIAGIQTQIRELDAAFAQLKTEQTAGRDVNQNDKWTLRLLGLGLVLLGLSYPIGKIIWLATAALSRRARSGGPMPLPTREDMMAFRQNPMPRNDTMVSA